jgi:hypothetical protein
VVLAYKRRTSEVAQEKRIDLFAFHVPVLQTLLASLDRE